LPTFDTKHNRRNRKRVGCLDVLFGLPKHSHQIS
jgi:hypothetical protein